MLVLQLDPQGRIEMVNGNFESEMLYRAEQLLGRNIEDIVPAHVKSLDFYQRMKSAISRGEHLNGAFRLLRGNGREAWLRSILQPVKNSEGRIKYFTLGHEAAGGQTEKKGPAPQRAHRAGGIPVPIDRARQLDLRSAAALCVRRLGAGQQPSRHLTFLMLMGGGMLGGKRIVNEAAVRLATSDLLPPEADLTGTFVVTQPLALARWLARARMPGCGAGPGAASTVGFAHTGLGLRASLFVQYMPQEQLPILKEFPQAVRGRPDRDGPQSEITGLN